MRQMIEKSLDLFSISDASLKKSLTEKACLFLSERFQLQQQESGMKQDTITSVLQGNSDSVQELQLISLKNRMTALKKIRNHPDFADVAESYKRSVNILKQARNNKNCFFCESTQRISFPNS